jgi:Ca2+-binding EF-hand superfamily protein
MTRLLYVLLLRCHPRLFRQKFTEEMLWIFDQERTGRRSAGLLIDAAISLARQWVLRPDFREPPATAEAAVQQQLASLFHIVDSTPPRAAFLLHGAVVSLAWFALIAFAVKRGGEFPPLILGTHHQSPHLLGVERSSIEPAELTTEVRVQPPVADPLGSSASIYFRVIFVLRGLDADEDLILSPREIAQAPAALRKLDWNGDGRLDPMECGLHFGTETEAVAGGEGVQSRGSDRRFVRRAGVQFMQFHPVLAALDSDRDGEISYREIAASSLSLRGLDRNRDGSLEAAELLPDPVESQAAIYFSRVDVDADGVISATEASNAPDEQMKQMLAAADRNRDGAVTGAELLTEVRLRIERENQLRQAITAGGSSQ